MATRDAICSWVALLTTSGADKLMEVSRRGGLLGHCCYHGRALCSGLSLRWG
jgi:hypothetical protein